MAALILITAACPIIFHDDMWGVENNLRHGGRQEELTGDYETEILEIMKDWH